MHSSRGKRGKVFQYLPLNWNRLVSGMQLAGAEESHPASRWPGYRRLSHSFYTARSAYFRGCMRLAIAMIRLTVSQDTKTFCTPCADSRHRVAG